MSTSTTRLGLTKPASGEFVSITTLDSNFDLIDAAVATTVASAAALPASAFSGRLFYESDTGRFKLNRAASASAAASWVSIGANSNAADEVVYLSRSGSNSNDGLSPGAPLLSASAAMAALPSGGKIYLGAGTWSASALSPASNTHFQGVHRLETLLQLDTTGATLLDLTNSNCSFADIGFVAGASATSGTLIKLNGTLNHHFTRIHISGQWSPASAGYSGQVGVLGTANAGDSSFDQFVIGNLGVGAQIDSQHNYFTNGKFSANKFGVQGGDPTGVALNAGAGFDHVTFSGTGDRYVNITGTSRSWIFHDTWFDGFAASAVVVGASTLGPSYFAMESSPCLAGSATSLSINYADYSHLSGIRFGAAASTSPTDLTIAAAASAGTAFDLRARDGTSEFAASAFPSGWTFHPRTDAQQGKLSGRIYDIGASLPSTTSSFYQAGNSRARFGYDSALTSVILSDNNGGRDVVLRVGSTPKSLITATSTGNVHIGAKGAAEQSMVLGIFIANATTLPTGNPTAGGFLYVDAGALKYRGSSGTITTLGPA